MESQRILICLALFAACALAVNAAAIDQPSEANVEPKPQQEVNSAESAQPQPNEHNREKKWAYAYGYGLSSYPAPVAAPIAYSAYPSPYYPAYRALPAYYSVPGPAAYYI